MSDLQCPARILVARHGEATYPHPGLLTDAGGTLTQTGAAQAEGLAARLAGERVAAVYSSRLDRAVQTAAILGERLGLEPAVVEGVEEMSVGSLAGRPFDDADALEVFAAWADGDLDRRWPGAETGTELVARFAAAVDGLADRHRGEAVVVVSHGAVLTLGILCTAADLTFTTTHQAAVPNGAVAEVAVDADGWQLVGAWPGGRPDA